MGFGRSPLKFRHIYGEPAKKEHWYENIPTSKNAHDGRFIAANSQLIAIATESTGGGAFLVMPITKTGRITGMNMPRVCGHAGPILDLAWNPFEDSVIASASDDATVKVWRVDPENGLSADLTDAEVELHGHRRRTLYIDWHPSASDVLMSAGYDNQIIIWNVERRVPFQTLTAHSQQIHSIAWHREGRLIATTSKDKTLRIIDPRSGVVVMSATGAHAGPKASKTLFLDDNHLFSVGFGRHSDREYAVWTLDNNLEKPIQRQMIDQSSGVILPYYDHDCRVVYLIGKGDGNFRFYEYAEQNVHYLSQYISSTPQRGVGILPKRSLNTERCEIYRFYKQHVTANIVEPLSIIAPRRGPFRDDLYPPTAAPIPALTAEQWCYHSLNRAPVMMNLNDGCIINPPLPAAQAPAQTRPSIPASLLNMGHLTNTTEKEGPTTQHTAVVSTPFSTSRTVSGPMNGHHHVAQHQINPRPHERRVESRFEPESAPHMEVTTGAPQRRSSTGLGTQFEVPAQKERSPRQEREISAPPPASSQVEEEMEDQVEKVPDFRTLIQSFEKNSGDSPTAARPNSFARNQRRAQSMRERTRRPVTMDLSGVLQDVETRQYVSVNRPRYIRRPESLQSPEEQRRSIELSLHHRATAPQATATSMKVIEMKPHGGTQPPESYEELREAFLEQKKMIKKLRKELSRKDMEIDGLRAQVTSLQKSSVSRNNATFGSAVDSSFC